jgi:protein-disulfide isomerase
LSGLAHIGSTSAPVALVIFTDHECPFCGRFAREIWPAILEDYILTGKVLAAQWHRPLEAIHPAAKLAAAAVSCAGRIRNEFWKMNDLLFATPLALDEPSLYSKAESLGISRPELGECLAGPALAEVAQQGQSAAKLGITGTPAFFIGQLKAGSVRVTDRFAGAQPFEKFAEKLEKAIAQAR